MVSAMSVARGAAWTKGDVILIGTPNQMLAVPAAGGTPRPVAPLDTAHGETSQRFPLPLADGETVLYTSSQVGGGGAAGPDRGDVAVEGNHPAARPSGTTALAVLGDHLIYVNSAGSLMAVPFDSRHARVTGDPVPVGDGIAVGAYGQRLCCDFRQWLARLRGRHGDIADRIDRPAGTCEGAGPRFEDLRPPTVFAGRQAACRRRRRLLHRPISGSTTLARAFPPG